MKRFESKTALITGGASGIGQAIAINAAKEGARVIIADIDDRRAADTIDAIGAIEGASTAKYHKTDITDDQQVRGLIEFVSSQFNKLDYLCNSAGLQTYGTAETTSEQDWDLTMDVNLKSMFLVVKHAVPLIRAAGGGAIVNISSVQGLACQENVLAYATSKGAVIAMTRAMGMDYAKEGIRVNCICPGSVDTPLLRFGAAKHGDEEEVLKQWGSSHPIGRIGKADEIAKTALYLWSEDAGFIVGQSIVADGGLISKIL